MGCITIYGSVQYGFAGDRGCVGRRQIQGTISCIYRCQLFPQSFLDEKGQLVGFDIDVAIEVAKRLGVTAKFVTPDWDIIVSGKWGGRWDLSIGSMTITAERAQVVDFSIPYYYTPAQFAVHKNNKNINALNDFAGKNVGIGAGTTYDSYLNPKQPLTLGGGETIIHSVKNVKAKPYSTDMEAVQDLALGDGVRLNGVLTSGFVVQDAMKKGVPIKPVGNPVYYEPISAASDRARSGSTQFIKKISDNSHPLFSKGWEQRFLSLSSL